MIFKHKYFVTSSKMEKSNSLYRMAAKIIIDTMTIDVDLENYLFLSPLERNKLATICIKVKSWMDWNFDFQEFQDALCKVQFKIEALWNLHIFQILSLETYLLKACQISDTKHRILEGICELCSTDAEGDSSLSFVQTGVMSYLVNKAFGEAKEEIKGICLTILDSVLAAILISKEQDPSKARIPLVQIWYCGMIDKPTLQAFCTYILKHFLTLPGTTVMDVFSAQESIKRESGSLQHVILVQKIISTLECEQVQELLFSAASDTKTNWRNYLTVIDTFMMTHSQASVIMSQLITELTKESLHNQDQTSLEKAIVIGRQIALCSDFSFPIAYKQWFQAQFADNMLLRTPENFIFFIQILSDLLPYEKNIEIIKVSLDRLLHVPYECHSFYADYISLLKTRIKDLEPHVKPEEVLKKMLSAFQESGKIPPYIMEASLMRKHYFLNEFLPILLAPRIVPRIPDVQEKFIQELDRAGKIPGTILQKYRASCIEEERKLVLGFNMNEENFMEEM